MSRLHRLKWTLDRARAMPPEEWTWRLQRAFAVRAHRVLVSLGIEAGAVPERDLSPLLPDVEARLFGERPLRLLPWEGPGRADLARALETHGVGTRHDEMAAQAGLLSPLHQDETGGAVPDWNADPLSGRRFPLTHWSRIDYRDPAQEGGIRRLWYEARHSSLARLALPYYLSGEERAAARACALIQSWIDQCPPYRGIHWMIPLELALRLMAWSRGVRMIRGSAALARLGPVLARSVHLQAEHVLGGLSRHSSANNHLIAQAAGLVHAGIGFSGLKRAAVWRETGREIIWSEILRQTTEDGVSREASLHYHEFVLELALLTWLALDANGEEPPAAAQERIARMMDFMADAEAFPGGAPAIGDSDDQSVLPLALETTPRRTLLGLGAALFRRGDWRALARDLTASSAFLLGEEGRGRFSELLADRAHPVSRLYAGGGYAFLRDSSGDRGIFFDAGELGYMETAAHGHADCLAIACGAFGEPLLIDPGTYTYHAEPEYRDYFRSTAAHSTLRIDGCEQSEMRGAFLWGRKARGRFVDWATWPALDLVSGEHDGFMHLESPVGHRRTIVFIKPDYLWVIDDLAGSGDHLVESFLHFAPGMRLVGRDGTSVSAASRGGATLDVSVLSPAAPEMDWFHGHQRPLQGWSSPAFGRLEPAPVLRLSTAMPLPGAMHMLLRPRASGVAVQTASSAMLHPLAAGHVLSVRGMPGEDLVAIGGGHGMVEEGPLKGEVQLEGRMAMARWTDAGLVACVGYGLERVILRGEILAEAGGGTADFCYRRLGDQAVVEGRGGRLRLRAPGLREVRLNGRPLAAPVGGGWLELDLEGSSA